MFLPRRASSATGFLWGVFASIFSLVAVHAAVIVAHELADEAAPTNTVVYRVDRGIERVEILSSLLWGTESSIRLELHLAEERIDEIDSILSEEETVIDPDDIALLLDDAFASLKKAESHLATAVEEEGDHQNIELFTLALLVESTEADIARRIDFITEYVEDASLQTVLAHAGDEVSQLMRRSAEITEAFNVSEDVAAQVRTAVTQEIVDARLRRAPETESIPQCGIENQSCSNNADCCSNLGLRCMPVLRSDGTQPKRCVAQDIVVCQIDCQVTGERDGIWGSPGACTSGNPPPNTPHCDDIEGELCNLSANPERNRRLCQDI